MSHLILIAFEQKAFLFLALRLETLDRAFADSKAWQFLFSTLCSYLLVASCLFLLLAKISFFFLCPCKKKSVDTAARCAKQLLNCTVNKEFDHWNCGLWHCMPYFEKGGKGRKTVKNLSEVKAVMSVCEWNLIIEAQGVWGSGF